ncbi:major capsid protein [Halorhodospira sp. 9622]|uniref:major capsid protein n=1 Tax=Halorhodospira sp. 9622 TaxID=2899136 RepID=UPI001EE79769|nr:major capsid protein [Halorhodospira sp. 9622]MCG5538950.1 major capsid protein [Halorhodospira sp. 9622]
MATMDIFNQDAFSAVELTAAINKAPYRPARLNELGIFTPRPVRTKTVAVERREGKISVIPTSPRGGELAERENEKRDLRDFRTPRIAKGDTLYADEIAGIRAFGSESELMQVQREVARRYDGETGLLAEVELTHEHMRLGAVQGVVTDADGSVIYDWFDEWGISKPSPISFKLTDEKAQLRKTCNQIVRSVARSVGASFPGMGIHALCGDDFYDKLTDHPEVRETYKYQAAASELRTGNAWESFRFGGITFENYRGTDDESTIAIDSDKAQLFPVGAPGVFEVAYSPAEFLDTVNTPGQRVYGMLIPDRDRNAWVRQEIYSYPLFYCARPEALRTVKV